MARKRTTPKRRTKTTPPPPTAQHAGERIFILDIPFRTTAPGAQWVPAWKTHAYVGAALPDPLLPFASQPYSYQRWVEDDLNADPGEPMRDVAAKTPRQEQLDGAAAIVSAHRAGARQFLLADDPGTGKTITMILAAQTIARERATHSATPKILVTVDRPFVITAPHWRASIASVGDGGCRWLICSPDQLRKLLARNGRPRYTFDVQVYDESQLYRHQDTQRVSAMRRIARYSAEHATAPFLINATATPGHNPAELTYLAPAFAQLHNQPTSAWNDLGQRLVDAGLPLAKRYDRWQWGENAAASGRLQQEAADHVRRWLTDATPPLMLHRPSPQGQAPIEGMPTTLTAQQCAAYNAEWGDFQRDMGLARRGKNVAKGRAAIMRFRQKAGMLRIRATAEWASAQVDADRQVALSVEFVSTAAGPLCDELTGMNIPHSRIYGTGRFDTEAERIAFQTGSTKVCVFTVASSISLHAGEMLPNGQHATRAARVGVLHQPSYSGIATRQRLGRTHRDGQVSEWWLAYAEGTIEEQIAQVQLDRLRSTTNSVGGDTSALHKIAALLGADWLPDDALTNGD